MVGECQPRCDVTLLIGCNPRFASDTCSYFKKLRNLLRKYSLTLVTSIFTFFHNFFYHMKNKFNVFSNI